MTTTIILGVAMFTFVILALVFVLLAAKARLVNSEAVTIGINHDPANALRVRPKVTGGKRRQVQKKI